MQGCSRYRLTSRYEEAFWIWQLAYGSLVPRNVELGVNNPVVVDIRKALKKFHCPIHPTTDQGLIIEPKPSNWSENKMERGKYVLIV